MLTCVCEETIAGILPYFHELISIEISHQDVYMAKIRCPHCAAINQDVSEKEPCWQCGKRLGSNLTDTDNTPKTSVPTTTNFRASNIQKLQELQDAPPKKGFAPLIGVVFFILALILMYILFVRK